VSNTINCAKFSPNGAYVAYGDETGFVRVLEKEGEGFKSKWEGSMLDGIINEICWTREEPYCICAVGGGKKRAAGVNINNGNSCGDIKGANADVYSADIGPSMKMAVTGVD